MDRASAESVAVARGARVGREIDGDAALGQRGGQRLGRKQMPAGAAGRDAAPSGAAVRRGHQAAAPRRQRASSRCASIAARGRSRVSASSMPMP